MHLAAFPDFGPFAVPGGFVPRGRHWGTRVLGEPGPGVSRRGATSG